MTENYGIVCNHLGDKVFRAGAKCWLIWQQDDPTRAYLYGMSIGGRMVRRWTATKKTTNWRPAYLPATLRTIYCCDSKEAVALEAKRMSNESSMSREP